MRINIRNNLEFTGAFPNEHASVIPQINEKRY